MLARFISKFMRVLQAVEDLGDNVQGQRRFHRRAQVGQLLTNGAEVPTPDEIHGKVVLPVDDTDVED